ncbi:hypothetical protein ACIPK7_17715 [Pseudomonas sp. NPDC086581]|uniref:hypothetical protein n=1 Tax=Pseudomonas sp. NPDC086581 TaxID=3364432 RepID=UPI0038128EAA
MSSALVDAPIIIDMNDDRSLWEVQAQSLTAPPHFKEETMHNPLGLLGILLISQAVAFEIHPVSWRGGANDYDSSAVQLEFRADASAAQCHLRSYILDSRNQAIHEIITRQAYQPAYAKVLRGRTWLLPLLGGVEWNDDPEELTRKAWHYNGASHILLFKAHEENAGRPNTLTRRVHHGDLQFLHSMRAADESDAQARAKMYRWLEYTYRVAIGKVPANTVRKSTPYHEFFGKVGCSRNPQLADPSDCTVLDVFDMKHMYRQGDQEENLRSLAAGAIAHLIQDSYSASHTLRENGTGRLLQLYTYDAENQKSHCEKDGAYESNRAGIDMARAMTTELLGYVHRRESWEKASAFFYQTLGAPDAGPATTERRAGAVTDTWVSITR